MNKRIKAKWVKALLSGDFDQTRGALKDSNGYCCLGVLRDVLKPGSLLKGPDGAEMLHPTFRKEAGLTFEEQKGLADLNDAAGTYIDIHTPRGGWVNLEGIPFEVIAGFIDANL
jgi:hypothetical protein